MQNLIALLHDWTHGAALKSAIARQNREAADTDASGLAQALEKREVGHREWSCFTGDEGRA